jgi:Fe2+ transport system protein B
MDAHSRLSQLLAWLDEAKTVPFSTSVMVNRDAFADELEALAEELPAELREARLVLAERDEVLARAEREAERVAAAAREAHQRLVAESEVYREAERQAEKTLAEARGDASRVRVEADDYIDAKLAGFEIVLHKTLQTIERGRTRLADRLDHADQLGHADGPDADAEAEDEHRPGLYDHEAL